MFEFSPVIEWWRLCGTLPKRFRLPVAEVACKRAIAEDPSILYDSAEGAIGTSREIPLNRSSGMENSTGQHTLTKLVRVRLDHVPFPSGGPTTASG